MMPRYSSHVASRTREGLYEAGGIGISTCCHDDWCRCRNSLCGGNGRRTPSDNHVNVCRYEILHEFLKPLKATLRPALLEDHIPAVNVAELLEPLANRPPNHLASRIGSTWPNRANPVHFPRLLRLGGERRGEKADGDGDHQDECSAHLAPTPGNPNCGAGSHPERCRPARVGGSP